MTTGYVGFTDDIGEEVPRHCIDWLGRLLQEALRHAPAALAFSHQLAERLYRFSLQLRSNQRLHGHIIDSRVLDDHLTHLMELELLYLLLIQLGL